MSNIKKTSSENIQKIITLLIKFYKEKRLISSSKNPDFELQNSEIIEEKFTNDFKIRMSIIKNYINIFKKYLEKEMQKEAINLIDNFNKKESFILKNLIETIEWSSEKQISILLNLGEKTLLTLATIDNLSYVINELNQKDDLTPKFFELAETKPEVIETLVKNFDECIRTQDLSSIINSLNQENLTLKLFELAETKPEAIEALVSIRESHLLISKLNEKGLTLKFLELAETDPKFIKKLSKIFKLLDLIDYLNQIDLTPKFFDLVKTNPDGINALIEINTLFSLISKLNKKGLTTHKLFELVETKPEVIKVFNKNLHYFADYLTQEQLSDFFELDKEKFNTKSIINFIFPNISFPDESLEALEKIDDLWKIIFELNKEELVFKFLNIEKKNLEALSKIYDLSSIIKFLNEQNLTSQFLDLDLTSQFLDLDLTSQFLDLAKTNPEAIEALSKIKNLPNLINKLDSKELTSQFLDLAKTNPEAIEALAKIKDLSSIIKFLNEQNLTSKFLDLAEKDSEIIKALDKMMDADIMSDLHEMGLFFQFFELAETKPEAIKALAKIKDFPNFISYFYIKYEMENYDQGKKLIPKLFELVETNNLKAINALAKIGYLSDLINDELNPKELTSQFLDLAKTKPEAIEALSKIYDLFYVISKLNEKNLTPKLFELPLETLQNPNSIKEALNLDFNIIMKEELEPYLDFDIKMKEELKPYLDFDIKMKEELKPSIIFDISSQTCIAANQENSINK